MVPREGGAFAPSLVRRAEETADADVLEQVDRCGECHAEIVEEWRASVHRFASFNNPMYRLAFDEFVEENGHEKGAFCAGCHDPVPLMQGEIGEPVAPDLATAHVGVTCNTCHGIEEATTDGNGSYTLTTSEVPVPEADGEGLERHRERVSMPEGDGQAACVSCHRGFLSPATGHEVFILGFDEYGPWRRSGWAGNASTRVDEAVPDQSCVDCHMPKTGEHGTRSHRFAGGHTTAADMIGAAEQLEAVRRRLRGSATLDVAAAGTGEERLPSDPEAFQIGAGERFWFDVVVRNVRGGHNLPGGQRDLRDTWIEVVLKDAEGRVVAEAGREHRETGDDFSAHRLRALLLTSEAETEKGHRVAHFRTKAYDHTIGPRGGELSRYAWSIPEEFAEDRFPLRVEARLIHRRLTESFWERTCEASRTERGAAFLEETREILGAEVDVCGDQPLTTMATDTAEIRRDAFVPGGNKPRWKRWFERGLALQGHLSERLDETVDSFERSREALEESGASGEVRDRRRAMALVGKAQVLARQRRHREAIEVFDAAEALVGSQPSIYVGRGDAYANVWQFDRAVEQYRSAAESVDGARVWRKLAVGLGSLGEPADALVAAQKGLEIVPRDPDLLRSQMLALRDLDVPGRWRERAQSAFETYKRDEEAHRLRAECADRKEICRLERLPVHTHELEAPD